MQNGLDVGAGFQLSNWRVYPRRGVLECDDKTRRIEPRVMQVLLCLARNRGDVVMRDELIEEVWSGRVVGDEVLSRCVSVLRTQLGDDARAPSSIETLPKIGYRLIAPVSPIRAEPAASNEPAEADAASIEPARFESPSAESNKPGPLDFDARGRNAPSPPAGLGRTVALLALVLLAIGALSLSD